MAEWLKAHDSNSCRRQRLGGSNPLASARTSEIEAERSHFCVGGVIDFSFFWCYSYGYKRVKGVRLCVFILEAPSIVKEG